MSDCIEQGMLRGRPFGVVIVLVKKTLWHLTECVYCDERYVIVKFANCLIVNLYLPCVGSKDRLLICDDIIQQVTGWCERYSSCQYVLAGDLK